MARLDHIVDLRTFEALARTGSLTAGARDLGIALAVASKRLQRLEATLGFRLADRTTRSTRLTEEGERFLEHCRRVLEAADRAEDAMSHGGAAGTVRVAASAAFAQRQLAPRLPAFLARHPDVAVEIVTGTAFVDLVAEGMDVAFRQLSRTPRTMTSRPIAPDGHVLVASPRYLARAGTPRHPSELTTHRCLTVGVPPPASWPLTDGESVVEVPMARHVTGSDGEVAHAVALADGGIALKSAWDVLNDLAGGRLAHVLPDWHGGPREVHVVLPMREYVPRRVRALVSYFERELADAVAAWPDRRLFEHGA